MTSSNMRSLRIAHDNTMYEIEQRLKDSEYAKFKDMIERAKTHFHSRDKLKIYSKSHAVTDENGNSELNLNSTELTPLAIINAFRTVLDIMAGDKKEEKIIRARHKIRQQDFF